MGHAYTTLLCDVLSRYHRDLLREEAYFLTGTDEHTEKIVQAARTQGKEPHEYLEEIVERFKDLYARLDINYSQFIRTSDQTIHWPGAVEMWNRLLKSGKLEKRKYTGLYCIGCEAFKTERELVNGLCPDHDTFPEKIIEQNWFFKLSEFALQLEAIIERDEFHITPSSRKKEILTFIRAGLEDVSFSRPKTKMTWGIPVPNDPTQTMYIWVDALTNYISALGFGRGDELMRFWPGMHVIGKDILRFHAVFWPAMLLAAQLPLPQNLFVHGTIISGGKKMSKSLGNVISPYEIIGRYGKDATRYLLLRHVHPFEDTDITWEKLNEWHTANLVKGLGNLIARVMKLSEDNLEHPLNVDSYGYIFKDYLKEKIDEFRFDSAMEYIWMKIGELDKEIDDKKPWESKDLEVIKNLVLNLYRIGRMLEPFMPETSKKIIEATRENKKPENLFPRLAEASGGGSPRLT